MGIRASYWLTGGIMTVVGVALAQLITGFLGAVAVSIGGFLLAAALFMFKAALLLIAIWVVVRLARRRRREPAR